MGFNTVNDQFVTDEVAGGQQMTYEQFCTCFYELSGLDLTAYKRSQMEQRIRAFAARKGAATLPAFWDYLTTQPQALHQFLEQLTINVTYFFRDPEQFQLLKDLALPALLQERQTLSIWCAGCANGAEAYSLLMLLREIDAQARHHILATDIDRASLARARRGGYSAQDMNHVPTHFREQYFTRAGKNYQIDPQLRSHIDFQLHDLLYDPYPTQVDVILCRNVYIYFTQAVQHRILKQFHQTLRPGGFLLIGNTEQFLGAPALGFTTAAPHLYRKSR